MLKLKSKIREYRKLARLKQRELAELVGVRRETIFRLEKGMYNPSLKLAFDLAKVFNVSVEELFHFSDEAK
jgi:putative transcriptional regulator